MNIPSVIIKNFVVSPKEDGNTPMKQVWLDCENERLLATHGHQPSCALVAPKEPK